MHVFSAIASIELLDGIAVALLAAAASCRAKSFGANITGALVLGCLCGMAGPMTREVFLNGSNGARLVLLALPDNAIVGAAAGLCAAFILKKYPGRACFWLDSASMGLAASLGSVLGMPETGIAGGLCLGLTNGLLPGVIRDVALGDTAMLVDKNWYAAAAALGCILAMIICLVSHGAAFEQSAGEYAVVGGSALTFGLRIWKGFSDPD